MSNHLHLVLRIRPDLAQRWSDDEVALRWLRLHPPRNAEGKPVEPQDHDLAALKAKPGRIAQLRERLASLSWFMRSLCEPIARRANKEDQTSGRFWSGRFRSLALLDEAAVLACSVYVDLNPIRAEIAETPEDSAFTSAYDRIQARRERASKPATRDRALADQPCETSDAWLCEFTLDEGNPDPVDRSGESVPISALGTSVASEPDQAAKVVPAPQSVGSASSTSSPPPSEGVPLRVVFPSRASNRGYLAMELDKYLSLLDWTGRQLRASKRGAIPEHLAPILDRLGVRDANWLDTVRRFDGWFKRAAGRSNVLREAAARAARHWFQGVRAARQAFA
jgi:REP element-mobilizing transposase RayT